MSTQNRHLVHGKAYSQFPRGKISMLDLKVEASKAMTGGEPIWFQAETAEGERQR